MSIPEHPLIRALVPDPASVPDLQVLVGFLGESARPGHVRLYQAADLTDYIEFPREDFVHHAQLMGDEDPLGSTAVWIRREAQLIHTTVRSRDVQAEFFTGSLATAFHGRPAGGACDEDPNITVIIVNPRPWTQDWSTCAKNCV